MNHLAFFGFTEDPFRLTPDRDFYFPAASHTAIGQVVRFGLEQGDGFIIVIGEVGTGKTMLVRSLLQEIGDRFVTALLLSPQLTPKQLLQAIFLDLGLGENRARDRQSLDSLLRELNDYLYSLARDHKRLVIIIDEAQNLPDESIEQLRLLSNFESDKQKWLQIVLVGQPELKIKVEKPHLRQLLHRVTILERLLPLSRDEAMQYVHFRLNRAGRGDLRLTPSTCRVLWRHTKGVPRLINKLMNRALLVAYAEQQQEITSRTLTEAAKSLPMPHGSRIPSRRTLVYGLAAVFLLAVCWLAFGLSRPGWQ